MDAIDNLSVWKQIPLEEKLEMMARAHSKGVAAATFSTISAATCAVALQIPWLFWAGLLLAPMVFQFTSGKAWRSIKPITMLQYLAARSAARRHAFTANAGKLGLSLMFKGYLQEIESQSETEEGLQEIIENTQQTEVWIALFEDAFVIMSERAGGAEAEVAHLIDEKVIMEAHSTSGDEYASDKEVFLEVPKSKGEASENIRYRLTSRYPAALLVFEKRLEAGLSKFSGTKEANALIDPDAEGENPEAGQSDFF